MGKVPSRHDETPTKLSQQYGGKKREVGGRSAREKDRQAKGGGRTAGNEGAERITGCQREAITTIEALQRGNLSNNEGARARFSAGAEQGKGADPEG